MAPSLRLRSSRLLGLAVLGLLALLPGAAATSGALRRNALLSAVPASRRLLIDSSDLGCYGNYCGLQESCAGDKLLSPDQREAPIDSLDAACFLHDVCYTCAHTSPEGNSTDSCCPDASLIGVDEAECDRVFLHRLKNDDLCDDPPNDRNVTDIVPDEDRNITALASVPELVGCDATRRAAIVIFEVILRGREFSDELKGDGRPSATNNLNATCPAFQCPFTGNSKCFQPCGDDGCGAQCGDGRDSEQGAGSCPSGQVCHPYAHACFFPRSLDNDGASAAALTSSPLQMAVAGALVAATGLAAMML